jgi:hypothetical protein
MCPTAQASVMVVRVMTLDFASPSPTLWSDEGLFLYLNTLYFLLYTYPTASIFLIFTILLL